MTISEIACNRPLIVHFTCERFNITRMALPRIINATRKIGGYLWVIDDGTTDERMYPYLKQFQDRGLIDCVTYGKNRRFIDWTKTADRAWGGPCARNLVAFRLLTVHNAPLVIFIHSDIVVSEDSFLTLLNGSYVARKNNLPASCFCGFRCCRTIFSWPKIILEGFEFRFNGGFNALQFNLITLDTVRLLEKQFPSKLASRWSVNEYAVRAYEKLNLESSYIMNIESQHLGVNLLGRTFTEERFSLDSAQPFAWEEDGSFQQVQGFDVNAFMIKSEQSCYQVQAFAYQDKVEIIKKHPVPKVFHDLVEFINE